MLCDIFFLKSNIYNLKNNKALLRTGGINGGTS